MYFFNFGGIFVLGSRSEAEEDDEEEQQEDEDEDELLHLEESDTELPCDDDDIVPVLQVKLLPLWDPAFSFLFCLLRFNPLKPA